MTDSPVFMPGWPSARQNAQRDSHAEGSPPKRSPRELIHFSRVEGAFATLGVTVGAYMLLLLVAPADLIPQINEGVQVVGSLVATTVFGVTAWRSPSSPFRRAWLWLALAIACNVVAESIYAYLVFARHQEDPFRTLADAFYLQFYVFATIGVLLLPRVPLMRSQRVKLLLDGGIVAGALLTAVWFFLHGPTFFADPGSPLALALSLSYPIGDLILITALAFLILRGLRASSSRPTDSSSGVSAALSMPMSPTRISLCGTPIPQG